MKVVVSEFGDALRVSKEQAHAVLFGGNKPTVAWTTPLKDSNIIHDKCGGPVHFLDYVYDDFQLLLCGACGLRLMIGWPEGWEDQTGKVEDWWDLLRACAGFNDKDVVSEAAKAVAKSETPPTK